MLSCLATLEDPLMQVRVLEPHLITLELATHYNQRQVAGRVSECITVHLFQSLTPLLVLSKK